MSEGLKVQTRLSAKRLAELDGLARALGTSRYALIREFIVQGVKARLGTLEEQRHLEAEMAILREREAAALEKVAKEARRRRVKEAGPFEAILHTLNAGDGEEALARFQELTPHVQANVLRRLQKEAPELAARLEALQEAAP